MFKLWSKLHSISLAMFFFKGKSVKGEGKNKKPPCPQKEYLSKLPAEHWKKLLASLNHFGAWGQGIKADAPALLTGSSFRTSWQEEAVGEVFCWASLLRKAILQVFRFLEVMWQVTSWCLIWRLWGQKYLSVTLSSPPTATSLYFLCFGAFCLKKNSPLG